MITAAARSCADINRRRARDDEHRSDAPIPHGCFSEKEEERFVADDAWSPERLTVEHLTITALLRQLSPREQKVITHLYLMGADTEQVAKYLGVTPDHLYVIAMRARRHARAILTDMERVHAS